MPYANYELQKANSRERYARLKGGILAEQRRQYREDSEHREKILARNKGWRTRHRSTYVRSAVVAQKKRYHEDPEYRLRICLRKRAQKAVSGNLKSARTVELLGCTISELRTHLESLFVPGMTWENHGPVWHVDHVKPCARFDLSDPAQQRECFGWKNLQPLFAQDNLVKGDR